LTAAYLRTLSNGTYSTFVAEYVDGRSDPMTLTVKRPTVVGTGGTRLWSGGDSSLWLWLGGLALLSLGGLGAVTLWKRRRATRAA